MTRKPKHSAFGDPIDSTASSYQMPAYGTPPIEPSSPLREPPRPTRALRLPGIDDRLARPEEGEEYVDGERIGWEAMAGESDHADPQCQLAYVVRACVADGYVAATELLTRSDQKSDFATDVCVRREGIDPATGSRYLEEISFEVANAQTRAKLEKRAKKLMARGVRRVFGLMVKEEKVLEWTRASGFKERPLHGQIRGRTLKRPLRVRAILDAAEADRLVAEALWEKREPYLVKLVAKGEAKGRKEGHDEGRREGHEEGRKEGRVEGLRRTVEDLCQLLGIEWSIEHKSQVEAMSLSKLEALRKHLMTQKHWP